MVWQDWFGGLFGPGSQGAATPEERVKKLEEQATSAETAATLRKRAIEARRRIAEAKKVAPGRGLTFWIMVIGALLILLMFARSCF